MSSRSFHDMMEEDRYDAMFNPGRDFRVLSGDRHFAEEQREQINRFTPPTEYQSRQLSYTTGLEQELKQLEAKLNEAEHQQYELHVNALDTTSEKIYFLKLPTMEKREAYVSSKPTHTGVRRDIASIWREPSSTQSFSSLKVGMRKSDVERLWGRPSRIDMAGDPRYENERWLYYDGQAGRYIYFEQGLVGGWSNTK